MHWYVDGPKVPDAPNVSQCLSFYLQKRLLLQLTEQREAVEKEVRAHRTVQHRNVLRLVDHEIRDLRRGGSTALLLFPYYRVCVATAHAEKRVHWHGGCENVVSSSSISVTLWSLSCECFWLLHTRASNIITL